MRIIVNGGVASGTKAAAKAHRVGSDHEIIIYQDEAELSYPACGLPYVISGVINDERKFFFASLKILQKKASRSWLNLFMNLISRPQLSRKRCEFYPGSILKWPSLFMNSCLKTILN